ncbi:MAG TPA: hypothetical protein VFB68_00200 [Xanthobacteraceae bacterium]|nr:hypothetical protein [Xanthobacteraceae bacterium]
MRGHGLATRPATTAFERLGINKTAVLGAAAGVMLLSLGAFGFGAVSPASRSDNISSSHAAQLAEGFRNASGSLLPVDLSTAEQRGALLDALNLTKPQAQRLLAMVDRGERMLGWITLWDSSDEDGDVASVTASGITQHVTLTRAPTRVLVVYVPGQPVYVTGERDGMGGGVTLSVELSTGPLPLPPLAVGQTVALPIQ